MNSQDGSELQIFSYFKSDSSFTPLEVIGASFEGALNLFGNQSYHSGLF